MPFKSPITVQDAVNAIHEQRYLLPAIQRELVWDDVRICRLFDSLMRDYPISSLLFWKVPGSKKSEFQFYEFLRHFHERDFRHNIKADVHGESDITAILDGQQRLTALYIGLRGSYAQKIRWRRWDNPSAFPKKEMYLNLAEPLDEEERFQKDMLYDFAFLTAHEAAHNDESAFWFKVGSILDFSKDDPSQIYAYLVEQGLGNNSFSGKCLFKLSQVIQRDLVINYFEEEDPDLEKALNIFVRINSSGVPLSYSDLLLSIATSQWQHVDAREEINDLVDALNGVGNRFNFDRNFVLKAALVLTDEDVRFRVHNFNRANMLKIESNWDTIKAALTTAVHLVSSFGFDARTLTANNSVIPIAYYLQSIGAASNYVTQSKHREDRNGVRRWLTAALLKELFSGQSDTTLRGLREVIRGITSFADGQLEGELLKRGLSTRFDAEEIEALLDTGYATSRAFLVLSLIYPTLDYKNLFHLDHIYPKSLFTATRLSRRGIPDEKHDQFLQRYNRIGNIQLLEGPVNQEKQAQDFDQWLSTISPDPRVRTEYMQRHYIPDTNLSFENFPEVFKDREQLIVQHLRELLTVSL